MDKRTLFVEMFYLFFMAESAPFTQHVSKWVNLAALHVIGDFTVYFTLPPCLSSCQSHNIADELLCRSNQNRSGV